MGMCMKAAAFVWLSTCKRALIVNLLLFAFPNQTHFWANFHALAMLLFISNSRAYTTKCNPFGIKRNKNDKMHTNERKIQIVSNPSRMSRMLRAQQRNNHIIANAEISWKNGAEERLFVQKVSSDWNCGFVFLFSGFIEYVNSGTVIFRFSKLFTPCSYHTMNLTVKTPTQTCAKKKKDIKSIKYSIDTIANDSLKTVTIKQANHTSGWPLESPKIPTN